MLAPEQMLACRIRIRGLVQGVGFRPAVHRLATALNLRGWVCNDADGVSIHIEGDDAKLDSFTCRLAEHVPAAATVDEIAREAAPRTGCLDFQIRASAAIPASLSAQVPADRAICVDCRQEILDPTNRRFGHPFASCILCGPRYTILNAMPYARDATTMSRFATCRTCSVEYADPSDRRFVAEPVACPQCGPRLGFADESDRPLTGDDCCIEAAAAVLCAGRILALKGLGGYQLLVRADDQAAVTRLRERKRRPSKPFAVMVPSLHAVEGIAFISPAERAALLDPTHPVVLVRSRDRLASAVAPGLRRVGVMLATTPLHVLLLSKLDFPVVATSGNRSEEPIAIDIDDRDLLQPIADAFLDHDRPIARRVDDSVVRVIDECPQVVRHARGFAPGRLTALERWAACADRAIPAVLAVGGQQKTALALWTGSQAVLAQHLGDQDRPEARRAFEEAARDLVNLYRCEPAALACDLHPDYWTTRWAQAGTVPFVQVQHHHAHAVAAMVEHDLLDRRVLGVIFDGTGFGPDGTIWGGEIVDASMCDFRRIASLDLFAIPGGEAAIHEPNRIALSLLAATFGAKAIPAWLLDRLGFTIQRARVLLRMIERQVQSPLTSSAGRLFDGVAALLLNVHQVSYEGEAALLLEDAINAIPISEYRIETYLDQAGVRRGDWRSLIKDVVSDIANGVASGICAARFHEALVSWASSIAAESEFDNIVLGGGCFQNAYFTSRLRQRLEKLGKRVHVPSRIPANDGGLAVGQLAVAMAHWNANSRS
jgi:hydrogenase maturation protein HypF